MSRQHRVKTYSAETGIVYQYGFVGQRPARRGWFRRGTEYLFDVSPDRRSNFRVLIFLGQAAAAAWADEHGRVLSSSERYAAAKLRLLLAFDEIEDLAQQALGIEIASGQLDPLLARLGRE